MENKNIFQGNIEEMKRGYHYNDNADAYTCLICGESFERGIIYKDGERLMEAEKAVKLHVEKEHGSTFYQLLNVNKKLIGITDSMKEFLQYYYKGLNDKEIAARMGISNSTVRSYRFKLKEKELQAKVFLSIIELVEEKKQQSSCEEALAEEWAGLHLGATTIDERYHITKEEREDIIKNYFIDGEKGRLKTFPAKEKKKLAVLNIIASNFNRGRQYSEKEINRILERIYEDYATLRRYLIEYGFLDRAKDCSSYWVKE